eukprot:2155705-Rhodomonas_salina.1
MGVERISVQFSEAEVCDVPREPLRRDRVSTIRTAPHMIASVHERSHRRHIISTIRGAPHATIA